jgi:hypothetical protein
LHKGREIFRPVTGQLTILIAQIRHHDLVCAVQAKHAASEQHKLLAEKSALIETVKRLNREVAKLEHFKRSLLQQLQEDDQEYGA